MATGNAHKVAEIRDNLGPGVHLLSTRDVPSGIEPNETGATFEANARIKAVAWALHLARTPGLPTIHWVLADDSGLEVDALDGAPGVHSARFAARETGRPGNSPDGENNAKLLRLLDAIPDERRIARFRCVLALSPVIAGAPENELMARTRCVGGACEGRITRSAAGGHGFGYDPLFVPEGYTESFAQLGEHIKNSISHRARALVQLRELLTPPH
ncbi:MAG: non-canonical purine NTP pyrophosphatase [Verrucomicrobiales bacterium]|nr:non-canonical purine NTP pyrophosphatase [Verrucomicrobiales bacterium]